MTVYPKSRHGFPDHDERHAMSTSCIRTNGKQHPQIADYHNRYFTTEHYKRMNMLPESMALIGVGEMEKPLSITMHDAIGISVSSHKTIVLRAGKGISISGKNVVFKTQRELRVIQGLGGTAKIEICNKIDVDAPKTNVKMTYHSATGRSQEKPSPDEDALAKVLMFVLGAAMITCVTATADLGPAGLMFGAVAGRVLPRITTGSGQIMMITGAAVPTLTAEALKRLGERLQALKNALISLGTYFPYSIFADQFLKQIPDEPTPLYDGPYPDQENPWTEAAWDLFEDIGIAIADAGGGALTAIADDISGENRTYTPTGNNTAFSVGRIAGHTGSLIGSFLGMVAGAFGVAAGGAEAVAAIPTTGGTLSGAGVSVAAGGAALAAGSVGVAENALENAGSDPNISFSQSNGNGDKPPKGKSESIRTNTGKEIDITPEKNHSIKTDNPGPYGEANSSADILDKKGEVATRRWYDSEGHAYRDVDMGNHGNPKQHPEWPHQHTWDWSTGKPVRKEMF